MRRFCSIFGYALTFMFSVNLALPAEDSADPLQAQVEAGLRAKDGKPGDTKRYTLEERMRHYHMVGVSLAVVDKGKVAWQKGYGVLEAGKPERVTAETRFQAASISKPVSCFGSLLLVQQGKLKLDEPINNELRTWKLPENNFTRQTPVTLRMLESHSAGVNVHGFGGYPAKAPLPTINDILDGKPPANSPPLLVEEPPNERVKYSGGGMVMMQKVVEDASGEKFAEFMGKNVLHQIGMNHSTYFIMQPAMPLPQFATAHDLGGHPIEGRWHRYPESTAAGLWTTAGDLCRFIVALQQGKEGKANPVLSQEMVTEMLTPQKKGVGLGIFLAGQGKGRRFDHNGGNAGFESLMVGFMETGQGFAVLVNGNGAGKLVQEILGSIEEAYQWPNRPKDVEE